MPGPDNGCHLHATTTNTTCTCLPSDCGGGSDGNRPLGPRASNGTRLFVIGDSISEGMEGMLRTALKPDGWSLQHNPGNGDNANYGAHCVPRWVPLKPTAVAPDPAASSALSSSPLVDGLSERAADPPFDVISFQFGLHDIAYNDFDINQIRALFACFYHRRPRGGIAWSISRCSMPDAE